MAAYAALNSVMYILQQIENHPRPPITIEKQYMDSLCEIISFLQDFLENHSHLHIGGGDDYKLEELESRIADAAYAAEDLIESHVVDQILAKSRENRRFYQNLQKHIEGHETRSLDYLLNHVMDRLTGYPTDLREVLRTFEMHGRGGVDEETLEEMVRVIADAAYADEQNNFMHHIRRGFKKMIRSLKGSHDHKTDHKIPSGDEERSSNSLFCQDLQKVIEDINLIKKEVMEIQEKIVGINNYQLPRSIIGTSTVPPPKRKNNNIMVGADDVLKQIRDRLTGYPIDRREVLPIVGMGGIGKTTLARNAYDDQFIRRHFDIRVWVTISQEYRPRDILLEALSWVDPDFNKDKNKSTNENELRDKLHKSLYGRRYLIILDDMWSIEAWENLMLFFPDNNNGSRIIITTRLSSLAKCFRSHSLELNFLDEDNSWDLFCKIVFPQGSCPLELEKTGKKIARNCKGLPLSIVVIGGLLANLEKTQQQWENVEKNLNSTINLEDDQHCLKTLFLSYNHLPVHLKPCFLYMGVFPEDSVIRVSRVIGLWVGEGFLKPIKDKTLEMAAQEYFNQLIDRNLILADKWGSSGKVKFCKIHDLLRDLCLREAKKNKFLGVSIGVHDSDNLEKIQNQRRISIHKGGHDVVDRVFKSLPSTPLSRSLICHFEWDASMLSHHLSLVRVISMGTDDRYFSSKLVNSRYLDFVSGLQSSFTLRSWIHLLWNLQTLIIKVHYSNKVPTEIWGMSELRHLQIMRFSLPDPPNVPDNDVVILRNLHTLKRVQNLKLSEEVIKRIPNIKKLELIYHVHGEEGCVHNFCLYNLVLLDKLESLSISEMEFHIEVVRNIVLPRSLKKLTLYNTYLLWEDMTKIGSLPCLEVLKLEMDSFKGDEWNPDEDEFRCLKLLVIDECNDLVYWNANSSHFPSLEKLVLRFLDKLQEIPSEIGEIPTLEYIELRRCCDSAVMSAKKIQDQQVELGNEDLKIICLEDIEHEIARRKSSLMFENLGLGYKDF